MTLVSTGQCSGDKFDISDTDAQNLLASIIIPPRPTTLVAIQDAQSQERGLQYIAEIISKDMSLSAAVLKTINSAFYGLRDKVTSIDRAVSLLGMKNISTLVMGLSLRKSLSNNAHLDIFWDHCDRTAMVAAYVADKLGVTHKDESHLLGLFHDCGKVLLMQRFPHYSDVLKRASESKSKNLVQFEDEMCGTNHCVAGKLLAKAWELPEILVDAIASHHNIGIFIARQIPHSVMTLIAVNHLAEYLANAESDYNDSEWTAYHSVFNEHLLLSENDINEMLWDVQKLFELQ